MPELKKHEGGPAAPASAAPAEPRVSAGLLGS
jgi:hypothetical protein